ncbi:MAG: hypothetical protein DMD77_21610 [Candidatus Rokuibacteriota bacterium]|nr:MAG: hypothetical protein DMD77_21610 [Candidatus Rokubacteria bacterium]
MSNSVSALLSATFYEPGYDHLVELVHQRDPEARRRLSSLDLSAYGPDGKLLLEHGLDTRDETLDLGALLASTAREHGRVMAVFDARYEEDAFPYRPHHYAYVHRTGSVTPALYYAVSAALGGVPDRIGDMSRINNFDTYVFRRGPHAARYSVMLGNVGRFAPTEAQVFAYYGAERVEETVPLGPRAHAEVALAPERGGQPLTRVETKSLFRLAGYVVGRRDPSGDLVLFDHLFTFFK